MVVQVSCILRLL